MQHVERTSENFGNIVPAKIRRLRLITEIRRMVGNGLSYREIMDTLGIRERSFYRYLSQAYEHDRQLLQEQDKNNLALELWILHERLTNAYRRLVLIASNEEEDISAKDRINAEAAAACEVALAITKLAFDGPIILKGFRSLLALTLAQMELKVQVDRCPLDCQNFMTAIPTKYR